MQKFSAACIITIIKCNEDTNESIKSNFYKSSIERILIPCITPSPFFALFVCGLHTLTCIVQSNQTNTDRY